MKLLLIVVLVLLTANLMFSLYLYQQFNTVGKNHFSTNICVDTVKAINYVLIDSTGRPKGAFEAIGDNARLFFLDSVNVKRVFLGISKSTGSSFIGLQEPSGDRKILLLSNSEETRISLLDSIKSLGSFEINKADFLDSYDYNFAKLSLSNHQGKGSITLRGGLDCGLTYTGREDLKISLSEMIQISSDYSESSVGVGLVFTDGNSSNCQFTLMENKGFKMQIADKNKKTRLSIGHSSLMNSKTGELTINPAKIDIFNKEEELIWEAP